MKKFKSSQRLISLMIGSLLAMESSGLQASDDELLMFVEVSKLDQAAGPVTSKRSLSANEIANLLAQKKASQLVTTQNMVSSRVPTSQPLPAKAASPKNSNPETDFSAPLKQKPVAMQSATPGKPLFAVESETQSPAPIRQISAPTRVPDGTLNELPMFKPATTLAAISTQKNAEPTPQLTPEPKLSIATAPASVLSVSPAETELRAIFYRAVVTALARSPKLRSSELQIEAAKEDVSNAKGQRWPQVDVTSNSRRYEFGKGNRNGSDSNIPTLGMNIATNLIDFGQTSNTIKSKELSVKAADYQNNAQVEDLAWQVSSGLIELSKQRLIIDMSKQYVARMQELVTMLSGIVEADQGRRSELTQATGRYLQAQSALDNAVAKARDTEITLYRLLGETRAPLPPATQWKLQPSQLDSLLAMVDKHPILQQAQAQASAAFAEADALKSSSLPKVNWVVSKDTGKDINGREQAWQTGINVSWGLFRGGSAKAAEQAAVQRAAAMREQSEDQRDDLQLRVRAADQDARSMLQRADLYRNLTRESDRIRLDFFDQWYHLGKRTLLDVLSAESDYYNNRIGEVTNRFDGYSAIFRGYASAGQLTQWLKGASNNNSLPRGDNSSIR
ncbi:TolC family protein [Pantoea agglomerans]